MTIEVSDVMRETKNYFPAAHAAGRWTVKDGKISPLPFGKPGLVAFGQGCPQPGVYEVKEDASVEMPEGEWAGAAWLLEPPKDFLKLCEDIEAWAKGQNLGVEKESFGLYSVTRASGWQQAFARALRPYRRMFTEVKV